MSIKIKFDKINKNPLAPTLVLTKRNGEKIQVIDAHKIVLSDSLNAPSEISFEVYKYKDNKLNPLWDMLKDFKIAWLKELDVYFELYVDIDESTTTVKKVTGKSISESELSQVNVYDLKINQESNQSDRVVLYSANDKAHSLIDMILKFAPNYELIHIDDSLVNIANTYSFDKKSVYDAFAEISKTSDALFVYFKRYFGWSIQTVR